MMLGGTRNCKALFNLAQSCQHTCDYTWARLTVVLTDVGRPVDVLQMPDGAILVSDDQLGALYRVSYTAPSLATQSFLGVGV